MFPEIVKAFACLPEVAFYLMGTCIFLGGCVVALAGAARVAADLWRTR